jgi:LacI family transcriptional regulator
MKITIKEVAQEAGVSISTVSRVLNGKNRVNKLTRKKVEEAIKKLDFQPDQIARTMIMKETKTIGLVVPQLSNEYWAILSEVIQERLWEKGYSLFICSTDRKWEQETAAYRSFLERRVDGIILHGATQTCEGNRFSIIEQMKSHSIPMVSFDTRIPGLHCVAGDHLQGAIDAVEHLVQLGHKEIAYIGGPSVSHHRELGYRNVFMQHHLEVDESLIKRGTDQTIHFTKFGYTSMEALINEKKQFSAVFCGNDLIAIGASKALEKAGIRVPQEVALVGFDDINMASLYKPALTTVRQPIRDMGQAAVDLLLELKQNNDLHSAPTKLLFEMELVIRESCGSKISSNEHSWTR